MQPGVQSKGVYVQHLGLLHAIVCDWLPSRAIKNNLYTQSLNLYLVYINTVAGSEPTSAALKQSIPIFNLKMCFSACFKWDQTQNPGFDL